MMATPLPRVMWLLNDSRTRRFEIAMLKRIGVTEIFLPKRYPVDPEFCDASVDWSEDAGLTIPADALAVLNAADWYCEPGNEAWDIANRYFSVMMFTLHHPEFMHAVSRRFRGVALWRAYGLPEGSTYTHVLHDRMNRSGEPSVRAMGNRFFFAQAYEHLHQTEGELLASRRLDLPLGLDDDTVHDEWRGNDKRILFVCPRIGIDPHYRAAYRAFSEDFRGLPYAIAGDQPVRIDDPRVLGRQDKEMLQRHLREMRVMFHPGDGPFPAHLHALEAIRAGMPLVYMAGGLFDRIGAGKLPGRCERRDEARRKIERILDGDRKLVAQIRDSQVRLLQSMRPDAHLEAWQKGFRQVFKSLRTVQGAQALTVYRRPRIAVIVPNKHRGAGMSGAKLLASAIHAGARQAGQPVDVIFGHIDDTSWYAKEDFENIPPPIKRRPYRWLTLDRDAAHRTLAYAGREQPLYADTYQVPEDGMKQFMDCDLWVIASDNLEHPVLPLRPYVLMAHGYLQRYQAQQGQEQHRNAINLAHHAERVFVSTEFTLHDAIQYAGLPRHQVIRVPMLARRLSKRPLFAEGQKEPQYFLWTTSLAPHKNHANALRALDLYYGEYGGQLNCCVTGAGSDQILRSRLEHLKPLRKLVDASPHLRKHLRLLGELPEHAYQSRLGNARFLWHTAWRDNGSLSVVEASQLGVPALSSDYPAMREIDTQFGLDIAWMDAHDPEQMARRLKDMELHAEQLQLRTPDVPASGLAIQAFDHLASDYWEAVRQCL